MRVLEGASEDWEVIPEPIGKWCNIQNDSDDVYQVNMQPQNTTIASRNQFREKKGKILLNMKIYQVTLTPYDHKVIILRLWRKKTFEDVI